MDVPKAQMATSFGSAAAVYEQGRPTYPAAAISWLVPDATVIADIGAGTGKFTQGLLAQGHEVIAIDPDAQMLAQLSSRLPSVITHVGSGEHIPLPDDSVDAVTFAQAWHWVDPLVAVPEVVRVLRPGGVLGLIWNVRDERVPWVARLTEIMKGSAAEELIAAGGPVLPAPFDRLATFTLEWEREISLDDLLAMAASRSYVITSPPERQAQIAGAIRELVATDPATAGRSSITLPYVTQAFRGVLPS